MEARSSQIGTPRGELVAVVSRARAAQAARQVQRASEANSDNLENWPADPRGLVVQSALAEGQDPSRPQPGTSLAV